jgi:hypothetical protein
MTTPTEKEDSGGYLDHAAKRVLIIVIVGFLLIGLVAPWAGL